MSNPSETTRHDDDRELIDLLRLSLIPGVGPKTRKKLLERFGTPAAVLAAAPSDLREIDGVGPKLLQKIASEEHRQYDAAAEIAACRASGIDILTENHPSYPRLLREIHDLPGVLFIRGELRPQDAMAIGIVGTRHATPYGLRQAERLAGSLSRAGFTIVSGLARGIDAAAHRGALAAGGRTIAVLASGVMNIYPPEHDKLAAEVAVQGAPKRGPAAHGAAFRHFPAAEPAHQRAGVGRNHRRGGRPQRRLITARHAYEQGKEVFAVPV